MEKLPISSAIDNKQYLLLGSRECETLFGYIKDGTWYANADNEDYELSRAPTSIVSIDTGVKFLYDEQPEIEVELYQVVMLQDERFQVAYYSKKYPFSSNQQWHLDVFGECVIQPNKRLGELNDISYI